MELHLVLPSRITHIKSNSSFTYLRLFYILPQVSFSSLTHTLHLTYYDFYNLNHSCHTTFRGLQIANGLFKINAQTEH